MKLKHFHTGTDIWMFNLWIVTVEKYQNRILCKGIPLNLDEDEFSVHECAAVLKNFLANLPEPLLTDAYYRAHCQVLPVLGYTHTV
jgi:hypothetical protein